MVCSVETWDSDYLSMSSEAFLEFGYVPTVLCDFSSYTCFWGCFHMQLSRKMLLSAGVS